MTGSGICGLTVGKLQDICYLFFWNCYQELDSDGSVDKSWVDCSIVQEGDLAAVEALLCPGAGGGWWARPSSKEVGLIITMWLQPAHVTRDTCSCVWA